MKCSITVLGATGMLVLSGCAPVDQTAEREAVMAADREFARATAERGAEGWVSYFADDGVMVQPGAEVRGQDAILASMEAAFADSTFRISWDPQRADVSQAGDLGYTVGRYETTRADENGDPIVARGTYVSIWKKNDSGDWRVVLDTGAPDPPEG